MILEKKHCNSKRSLGNTGFVVFFVLGLLFLSAGQALAGNPIYRMCLPFAYGVPGTGMVSHPTIDGKIYDDYGWDHAWRYTFNNGSYVPDVAIQSLRDSQYLYFSFEVNNDTDLYPDDSFIIAFDPTGDPADLRLMQIKPLGLDTVATPPVVNYWQWVGGTWTTATAPTTSIGVTAGGSGSNRSWFVEIGIPLTDPDLKIPAGGDFGIYINVVPVDGTMGTAVEHPWPPDSPLLSPDILSTPPVTTWGIASTGTGTCNGVYITPADISTNNGNLISTDTMTTNVFHALVHNVTTDSTGTAIPVNGIYATFKIADFGLGGTGDWDPLWNKVPGTPNPTAPTTINASSSLDFTTSWQLTSAQSTSYTAHQHQCILVELDSATYDPGTVFMSKSAWTNMQFETLSSFDAAPVLDGRSWVPAIRGKHGKPDKPVLFDLWVTKQIDQLNRQDALQALQTSPAGSNRQKLGRRTKGAWADISSLDYFPAEQSTSWQEYKQQLNNRSTQISQLTYLVHGCARTGKKVKIGSKQYEICQRMGSYGYVMRHAGRGKANWKFDLHGPGVSPVPGHEGRYQVSLTSPMKIQLGHHFEASDGPRSLPQVVRDWSNDHRMIVIAGAAIICIGLYMMLRRKTA